MKQLLEQLERGHKSITIQGVSKTSLAWTLIQCQKKAPQIVVICNNENSAQTMIRDLNSMGSHHALYYPAWDTIPFEHVSPSLSVSTERLHTLLSLRKASPSIVVTAPDALLQKVLPLECYTPLCKRLETNTLINYEQLLEDLLLAGYRSVSLVELPGDCAIRGNIVDVFPGGSEHPIRIEFLDDMVESLRLFSAQTQRSLERIQSIDLFPVREIPPHRSGENSDWIRALTQGIKSRGLTLELPPREIAKATHAVRSNLDLPGKELSVLAGAPERIAPLDLFPEDTLFVVEDIHQVQQHVAEIYQYLSAREHEVQESGYLFPSVASGIQTEEAFFDTLNRRPCIQVNSLSTTISEAEHVLPIRCERNLLLSNAKIQGSARASLSSCIPWIEQKRKQRYDLCFFVGTDSRAERLHDLMLQHDLGSTDIGSDLQAWYEKPGRPPIAIVRGNIEHGVQFIDDRICFIAEQEIFPQRSFRRKKARKTLRRVMQSLGSLEHGNIVVHEEFGIGRFLGLVSLTIEDIPGDFVHVEYADSTLYLPVQNMGRLQRYLSADEQNPRLDRLGSKRWARTRQKVKDSIVTLAGDLLTLYAERSIAEGWRYDPSGAEDERFADEFPYIETPDQMAAIEDVFSDMASSKPMDRLICGDVGFGKTEVAMRAAYKALQHGRQVAVLAPTTILVEQHKDTFQTRFDPFGVCVAAISRFYTTRENREVKAKLKDGSIDIIIGTHTLLSRSIEFENLGLLIVDEEHRFGVKQKEKLKQLTSDIDVLTLTATPIPRTLQMSLTQIRDVSVIATPPQQRRLIKTYITERNDTTVKDALVRELRRGGQAYVVHNRVRSIHLIADSIRDLLPDVRIEVAHGQMAEQDLENIMHRFVSHSIDVLVCTAIIESGLDIPNANTMIIDRSDMFGLAQLYQLRGRVGRSDRQSYCYFLIPESRRLGKEAQRRLKALQGIDNLGQGFQLALKDLEIRGAGNLLGKEQSGAMQAVGYEMYSKILEEAIAHVKGTESPLSQRVDPEVKLQIPAFLPEPYIPDITERIILYQRLSALTSLEDAAELKEEIIDRFGNPGIETENLFDLMALRAYLRCCGIEKLEAGENKITVSFHRDAPVDTDKVLSLITEQGTHYRLKGNHDLVVVVEKELALEEYLPLITRLWGTIRSSE